MSIAQNLRDLRRLAGMTQDEVASRVGFSRQTISSYESGRTQPDLDTLAKLAEIYNADINYVLYGQSRQQKDLRMIRRTAAITLVGALLPAFFASSLLLALNTFLPPQEITAAGLPGDLMAVRLRLLDIFYLLEGLAGMVSHIGSIILAAMAILLRAMPSARESLEMAAAFGVGAILCTVPLGILDPLYNLWDYLWIAIQILMPVALLMAFVAIKQLAKRLARPRPDAKGHKN